MALKYSVESQRDTNVQVELQESATAALGRGERPSSSWLLNRQLMSHQPPPSFYSCLSCLHCCFLFFFYLTVEKPIRFSTKSAPTSISHTQNVWKGNISGVLSSILYIKTDQWSLYRSPGCWLQKGPSAHLFPCPMSITLASFKQVWCQTVPVFSFLDLATSLPWSKTFLFFFPLQTFLAWVGT